MKLTVREALRLGALEKAAVVAGHAGLDREIRHVSVIEVPDAHHWFRGHELWLTALYTLKDDPGGQIQMLEHMCQRDSAALVVCYPRRYGPGLAEEVVARADELSFPLLQISGDVAYIDVIYPVYQEIVDRQTRELEYALRIHDQMTTLILENKGLQAVADALSGLIGSPVSVHDEKLEVKGLAVGSEDAFGSNLQSLWSADRLPVPRPDVTGTAVAIQEAIVTLPDTGEVVTVLARPIVSGRTVHGWMMVWLGSLVPHPWLHISLERACNVAALHLAKERAVLETERRVQRDFLDEMLFGNVKSESVLLARGRLVGWNLATKHIVLVAEHDGDEAAPPAEDDRAAGAFSGQAGIMLAAAVRAAGAGHVLVPRGDSAIVLLDMEPGTGAEAAGDQALALAVGMRDALAGELPGTVSIGIGSYQQGPAELWRSYEEARRAVSLGRKVFGPGHILPMADLKAFELLETVAGTPRAAQLVEDCIGPLQAYDREHGTQLLATLEAYFACRESARPTSERLFIHRNTLAYRLGKIHEVLGLDPFAEPHRFRYMLVLALRRLN
ncbi:MAG: PucR family transcriptional regulator ligand-binding domain-containing protein [bacterium]|nr:PucR family transcriptional regulator ligand-binding domain-containing protein [bacterium]